MFAFVGPIKAEIITEIDLPGREPYRILRDIQPDSYWVVLWSGGLLNLTEDQYGGWNYTEYVIQPVFDATGPDANGKLYLSFADYGQSGVYIFDCATATIEHTIVVGSDYHMKGITLSNDETRLYILGWDWPRVGEWGGLAESSVHRDSGIVWEIDTTTYEILNQGVTCAFPETIHYTDNDTLLVCTQEIHNLFDIWPQSEAVMIDVIETQYRLARIAQIQTMRTCIKYTHDFIEWSDEEPLVAMFATNLDWYQEETEEYVSAIWVINTETNDLVQTIKVFGEDSYELYVKHGVLSEVYPGRVYVTVHPGPTREGVYAIDKDTGTVIERYYTGDFNWTEFIHETPDGLLIVTCGGSEKILIIDPS